MKFHSVSFYILSLFSLIVLLFIGFYISFLTEKYITIPQYEKYNLPLRNNFWAGCEIYAKMKYLGKVGEGWFQCSNYEDYLIGIKDD
jgi:hypothetical protein